MDRTCINCCTIYISILKRWEFWTMILAISGAVVGMSVWDNMSTTYYTFPNATLTDADLGLDLVYSFKTFAYHLENDATTRPWMAGCADKIDNAVRDYNALERNFPAFNLTALGLPTHHVLSQDPLLTPATIVLLMPLTTLAFLAFPLLRVDAVGRAFFAIVQCASIVIIAGVASGPTYPGTIMAVATSGAYRTDFFEAGKLVMIAASVAFFAATILQIRMPVDFPDAVVSPPITRKDGDVTRAAVRDERMKRGATEFFFSPGVWIAVASWVVLAISYSYAGHDFEAVLTRNTYGVSPFTQTPYDARIITAAAYGNPLSCLNSTATDIVAGKYIPCTPANLTQCDLVTMSAVWGSKIGTVRRLLDFDPYDQDYRTPYYQMRYIIVALSVISVALVIFTGISFIAQMMDWVVEVLTATIMMVFLISLSRLLFMNYVLINAMPQLTANFDVPVYLSVSLALIILELLFFGIANWQNMQYNDLTISDKTVAGFTTPRTPRCDACNTDCTDPAIIEVGGKSWRVHKECVARVMANLNGDEEKQTLITTDRSSVSMTKPPARKMSRSVHFPDVDSSTTPTYLMSSVPLPSGSN